MWPKYVDMTDNECKLMLRKLELEAYSNMVSALRAQGPLTDEKQGLLLDIASELHIPRERYSAEIRRAVNDEKLSTIALQIYGPNTEIKWAIEGRREIPLIPRLHAQTAYSFLADKIANIAATENAKLPFPTKANRKEVQINQKPDVPKKRSARKTQPESKASTEVKDEKNCKEKEVKSATSDKSNNFSDGRVGTKPVNDKKDSKTSVLQKVSLSDLFGDSLPTVKKNESPVKRRKVVARSNVNKPLGTVVPKNVKNGKAIVTAKAVSSGTTKPTQIISAVKSTGATTGAKVVAVGSSTSPNMLKIMNKNLNSPYSSNSSLPLPSNSVVSGIKVMTPRSSATAAVPRSAHGSEFPRFMRPNFSSVRPNVSSNLPGVKNVVVMQKNSQIKRGVTVSSKDLTDKMLKRKPAGNAPPYLGPTASKVPKLSQDGSQNVATSQGNILVAGISKGNSSLPPQSSKLSRETTPANVGNNVKTYTKPKYPIPSDIPKSIVVTSSATSIKVTPVSAPLPMKVPPKASSSASLVAESKPKVTVAKVMKPIASAMNRIFTTNASLPDLIPGMPSTKIIITDNEGKVLGTVPTSSIASSQSQINLLFANSTEDSVAVSKTITFTTSSSPSKSIVVPSSKSNSSFVSLAEVASSDVPEKPSVQSNIFVSRERLVSSSSVCDKPIVSPKIQSESNLVLDQEPIVVNVPSSCSVECSDSSFNPCGTSNLSEGSEVLVNLNEADVEEVGVLDPVTGIYSFPFDETESNQDSTVSVNSLTSSVDLVDQLDCNLSSQMISVSPVPESVTDSSLSHILAESAESELKLDSTDLNESVVSTETVHECDISNISVTEVTLEETLECFESVTEEMYSEEIIEKDAPNIDSVSDHL